MGIADFIKNIAVSGRAAIKPRGEGIYIGKARKRLALVRSLRVAESYPRVRLAPSSRWKWVGCDAPFLLDVVGEANPHINISGSSGFGKSTLCKSLLTSMTKTLSIPVTVLDVHNEFVGHVQDIGGNVYSPREVSLNVWELDGLSPAERISENIEMFRRILDLGEIQAYNLLKCAEHAYRKSGIFQEDEGTWGRSPPNMRDVADALATSLCDVRNSKNASLLGLSKKLYAILMCSAFSNKSTVPFREIVSSPCGFTLGDLRSTEAQAMFIETFLRKLYSYMLSQKLVNKVGLYILIDEAHKVCISNSKGMSLPGRLVAEGRKYGIGIITSNQMAKSLDKSIVGNSSVTFAFHQKEPQEEEYIANLLSCGSEKARREEVKIALRYLKQFEALVITSKIRNPVKIRIDPPKEMPVRRSKEAERKLGKLEEQFPNVRSVVLGKLEMKVYRMGELQGEVGRKARETEGAISELQREGLVESVEVRNFDGKREMWVGRKRDDKSVEHSAYVALLAELLAKYNIPRTVLDCMDAPDIVAEFGGKHVAVEYETGKKKNDKKIREMLVRRAKEYWKVIVVTHAGNMKRYKCICAKLGVNVVCVTGVAYAFSEVSRKTHIF